MEEWIPMIQDFIKWVGISACVISPIYLIRTGLLMFLTEKAKNNIAKRDSEMLWENWLKEKELKRKEEWESILLKFKIASTEKNPEIDALKKEIEQLKKEKGNLEGALETEQKIQKSVMLFHKLVSDKEKVSSEKLGDSMKEIADTYEIIKQTICLK